MLKAEEMARGRAQLGKVSRLGKSRAKDAGSRIT